MKSYHEAMREARMEKGWSQAELSRRSGVPISGISSYERGMHVPSVITAGYLAQALGISIDEYIYGI